MVNPRNARIASVVAATAIALGCGTNYAYGAWGPDFAKHLGFTMTEGNVIGAAGNMGAYAMGVPAGLLIDSRGPQIGVAIGAIALGCGYFPIHSAYDAGPGSIGVGLLSFFSFLTGMGSCTAFSAALKTAAYNWPDNRGTATAFPLSGFGLSAFFFTGLGQAFFGDNISGFLMLLAFGTVLLNGVSFFFLRLIPASPNESALAAAEVARPNLSRMDTNKVRLRSGSVESLERQSFETNHTAETISLVSDPTPGMTRAETAMQDPTPRLEVTGIRLLLRVEFWQLFLLMGLLSGVGLMTINNVSNDATVLWRYHDKTASKAFIESREKFHVAILSLCSFLGRLASGIGSDFLIKRLNASRMWNLVISGAVFITAQVFAILISDPNWLFVVSTLTGLAYGALFGVMPALVGDTFGVHGLALNWGFMIFAPVITGNIFNVAYGRIFDSHVREMPDGTKECTQGINCYVTAYWITLASSIAALCLALFLCGRDQMAKMRRAIHPREA